MGLLLWREGWRWWAEGYAGACSIWPGIDAAAAGFHAERKWHASPERVKQTQHHNLLSSVKVLLKNRISVLKAA
jgi:hypothetical protein